MITRYSYYRIAIAPPYLRSTRLRLTHIYNRDCCLCRASIIRRSPLVLGGKVYSTSRSSDRGTGLRIPHLRAMAQYTFPTSKLRTLSQESRTPLVLVSCGSFSPITFLHLRMFEMCKDWVRSHSNYEIVGAYLSPVADAYKKSGLTSANHRIKMCQLAANESSWIMVDDWEAAKREYTRTAFVLDHFEEEINQKHGGIRTLSGSSKPAQVSLLSGADLLDTMSKPGVWAEEDLDHILRRYEAFIIERHGTDMQAAMSKLEPWRQFIHPIQQLIQNDVSSTKIRAFLGKEMSIRYLIPEPALKYIDEHGLFKPDHSPPASEKNSLDNSNQVNGVVDGAKS